MKGREPIYALPTLIKIIIGFLITIVVLIFLMTCLVDTTVSQEKPVKKISYATFSLSREFLLKKVTGLVIHWEYNKDSTNIVQVIDSVYIRENIK